MNSTREGELARPDGAVIYYKLYHHGGEPTNGLQPVLVCFNGAFLNLGMWRIAAEKANEKGVIVVTL